MYIQPFKTQNSSQSTKVFTQRISEATKDIANNYNEKKEGIRIRAVLTLHLNRKEQLVAGWKFWGANWNNVSLPSPFSSVIYLFEGLETSPFEPSIKIWYVIWWIPVSCVFFERRKRKLKVIFLFYLFLCFLPFETFKTLKILLIQCFFFHYKKGVSCLAICVIIYQEETVGWKGI